jgi:hypothetical protein
VTRITYEKEPEDIRASPNSTIDYFVSKNHLGRGLIGVDEKKMAELRSMTREIVSSLLDSTESFESIGSSLIINVNHNKHGKSSHSDPPASHQNPSYFVNHIRPAKASTMDPSGRLPDPPTTIQQYRQVCSTQR